MQWFIEVTDVTGDYSLIRAVLERAGYELSIQEHSAPNRLLSHPKYQEFETASQVHEDAKHLAETLRRFSELDGAELGVRFGAVQSKQPDGRTNKHIFAELRASLNVKMSANGTVTPNPAISEYERRRLIEEMQAKAAEQKRISIVRRASAALDHPRMLEVMKLMSIAEPTTTELGHIVDLVQDECGGDLKKYDIPETTQTI